MLHLLRRRRVRFLVQRQGEVAPIPDAERCTFWAQEARHRLAEGRWSAVLDDDHPTKPVVRLVG